jgi:hypothetical protein
VPLRPVNVDAAIAAIGNMRTIHGSFNSEAADCAPAAPALGTEEDEAEGEEVEEAADLVVLKVGRCKLKRVDTLLKSVKPVLKRLIPALETNM